jgi:hypothetical protein
MVLIRIDVDKAQYCVVVNTVMSNPISYIQEILIYLYINYILRWRINKFDILKSTSDITSQLLE